MELLRRRTLARILPVFFAVVLVLWALAHFSVIDLDGPSDWHPSGADLPYKSAPPPIPSPPPRAPPPPPSTGAVTKWNTRAEAVKKAFVHAYGGYRKYAGDKDELLPLSKDGVDNFNGWGVTMVDGLDTMVLMGLRDEFHEATAFIANLTFVAKTPEASFVPFFETIIRYLGGLLSAYALTGETIFLTRADDLGMKLLPAFNTTHGLPMFAVNTATGETRTGWGGDNILLAEALSCQMEFKYLAHLTGRKEYYQKVERLMDWVNTADVPGSQFPTMWSAQTSKPTNSQFSVGAYADSAHEYMLKQWLLTAKSEPKARDLYLRDVAAILDHLFYVTPRRGLLYVTDTANGAPSHRFEHLSCFLPGVLALGANTLGPELAPRERERHLWAAEGLAHTCWLTYADQATGLGPDEMSMAPRETDGAHAHPHGGRWRELLEEWDAAGRPGGTPPGVAEAPPVRAGQRDYSPSKHAYYLRPETVESFYVLWRTTGDSAWRERGWAVFEAIEKHARTEVGYASVASVETVPAQKKDEMPSFFLAETLKYLYLLFTDEDKVPLDKWVFNTEAHPLPIFEWTDWEKRWYGIR